MKSITKQTRPPGSAQKSPFNKENHEASSDKKRKIGRDIFGVRVMSEPRIRVRQAFSAVNIRQETGPTAEMDKVATPSGSIPATCDSAPMAMTKEDIETLLSMRMKGKNKFDFKGKCEQMMEYIKRLRACIYWFQQLESSFILQKGVLQDQLSDEKRDHRMTEDLLRSKQEELEMSLSEIKTMYAALEGRLSSTEAEKKDLLCTKEKDAQALQAAKREIACLLEEVDNAQKEHQSAIQQVASLQDINKRLQEYNTNLQLYNSKMQSDAATAAETVSRTQKEKSAMMETLSSLRGHSASLQEQLDQAKTHLLEGSRQKEALMGEVDRLHVEIQRILDDRDHHTAQIEALTAENARYKECTGKSAAELELLSSKNTALEESYSSQSVQIKSLRQKLDVANQKLQIAETSVKQHMSEEAEKIYKMEELQSRLAEAELRIHEGELVRRKLHNTILELKGNIRVFCRVRPSLPDEDECIGLELPVVQYPTSTELLGRGIELIQVQGQRHMFSFDKVFGPEIGQEDVFVEISQLIQSALDGYKVCIFAYGQTGSGKTHTMLGHPDIPEQKGVIPRSLEQIFKSSQALSSQGWSFRIQASMLEIYNETIRDLLVSGRNDIGTAKQYGVKHDQSGNTLVSDLTVVDVTNWKEVSSLLHRAAQSRAVGKTAMNEQSSRSHCVFTLRIFGFNESTEEQVHGVLNLIDLAGSERLSRSGSTGDRLKETQAINKSLASLGDVILAIANREQHIPYRNSKLTYLLQPCLGGESKTLMFVNISPDHKSANESLCSLRFAAKVNACEIGVPRRHTQIRMPPQDSRLSYG